MFNIYLTKFNEKDLLMSSGGAGQRRLEGRDGLESAPTMIPSSICVHLMDIL